MTATFKRTIFAEYCKTFVILSIILLIVNIIFYPNFVLMVFFLLLALTTVILSLLVDSYDFNYEITRKQNHLIISNGTNASTHIFQDDFILIIQNRDLWILDSLGNKEKYPYNQQMLKFLTEIQEK